MSWGCDRGESLAPRVTFDIGLTLIRGTESATTAPPRSVPTTSSGAGGDFDGWDVRGRWDGWRIQGLTQHDLEVIENLLPVVEPGG